MPRGPENNVKCPGEKEIQLLTADAEKMIALYKCRGV